MMVDSTGLYLLDRGISAHSPCPTVFYPFPPNFVKNGAKLLIEVLDYGTTPIHEPLGQITDGFLKDG